MEPVRVDRVAAEVPAEPGDRRRAKASGYEEVAQVAGPAAVRGELQQVRWRRGPAGLFRGRHQESGRQNLLAPRTHHDQTHRP